MSARIRVARWEDVPEGQSRCVRVNGRAIALHRVGGRIYATSDGCPHEGASLGAGGALEGEAITCGYHFWTFNVVTGESEDGLDERLTTYPVTVEDGAILVLLTAAHAPEGPLEV